jgi:hypothetical protein
MWGKPAVIAVLGSNNTSEMATLRFLMAEIYGLYSARDDLLWTERRHTRTIEASETICPGRSTRHREGASSFTSVDERSTLFFSRYPPLVCDLHQQADQSASKYDNLVASCLLMVNITRM